MRTRTPHFRAGLAACLALASTASGQAETAGTDLDRLARELTAPDGRAHAAERLTKARGDGAAAVGALLASDAELDDDALDAACRVLESLGPEGGRGLQGVVERYYATGQDSHRGRLVRCLGRVGAFAHEARDDWHKRLKDSDNSPLGSDGFFWTVGAMKADGLGGSADQLIETLGDENAYVRCGAALAIGHRAGDWSPEERKKLVAALVADLAAEGRSESFRMEWLWGSSNATTSGSVARSDLEAIRLRSRWALARLAPAHPEAAEGHVLDFGHTDPIVARKAIQMVMAAAAGRPGDGAIVEGLVDALRGDRGDVAREAAVALGIVGKGSARARRALEEIVSSAQNPRLVECAEAALAALGK